MIHVRRRQEEELHKLENNKHFYIHVRNWSDLGGNMKKMNSPQKQENFYVYTFDYF